MKTAILSALGVGEAEPLPALSSLGVFGDILLPLVPLKRVGEVEPMDHQVHDHNLTGISTCFPLKIDSRARAESGSLHKQQA